MVKICRGPCCRQSATPVKQSDKEDSTTLRTEQPKAREALSLSSAPTGSAGRADEPYTERPHVHLAAIDNSLSFPIHHPNSWRSYCYGWLFLPSSLVGLPFSSATREHFLPLLTDPTLWQQTVYELHKLFSVDEGFSERMFRRQVQVMKGQAWNVVKSLRNPEEGPLELCRRRTCLVYDEEMTVADDEVTRDLIRQTLSVPVPPEIGEDEDNGDHPAYRHGMARNLSTGAGVMPAPQGLSASLSAMNPPRSQRHISDGSHAVQRAVSPLPTSKHVDLSRPAYGSASGVSMINYMERLQRREEGNASAGAAADHREEGAGYGSTGWSQSRARDERQGVSLDLDREQLLAPGPADGDFRANLMDGRSRSGSIDEVTRRRSEGIKTASGRTARQDRIASSALLSEARTKTVIVEVRGRLHIQRPSATDTLSMQRLEYVDARPFFVKF